MLAVCRSQEEMAPVFTLANISSREYSTISSRGKDFCNGNKPVRGCVFVIFLLLRVTYNKRTDHVFRRPLRRWPAPNHSVIDDVSTTVHKTFNAVLHGLEYLRRVSPPIRDLARYP
jgi:hypothetical protein